MPADVRSLLEEIAAEMGLAVPENTDDLQLVSLICD